MLDLLLPLLKKPYRNETGALAALKKWLHSRKTSLTDAIKQANQHSTIGAEILFAAANRNYPKVLSYLLTLGFDASISLLPHGYNVLHHCILKNDIRLVDVCLQKSTVPLLETLSREGATPLFLATQQQNVELVKKLLAMGATTHTADIHGLTPIGAALLAMAPDILQALLAAPQSRSVLLDDLSDQTRLLTNLPDSPYKLRCLNLLFAAGVGLELTHIPESIFALYGLQKNNITDCLVLGEQLQANGLWKKKFLSTTEGLIKAIQSPTWRVNRLQLAKTCQHPLLQQTPAVLSIRDLFAAEYQQMSIAAASTLSQNNTLSSLRSDLRFPTLTTAELGSRVENQQAIANNCLQTIFSLSHPAERIPRLSLLTECAMFSIQDMIEIADYLPTVYQPSFATFNRLMASLMPIINTSTPIAGLPLMSALGDRIAIILKRHPALPQAARHLYNSLLDARALLNAKSARAYLALGKHDVAINMSLAALSLNEQLIIDNPMLQDSAKLTQAICLASSAEVYIAQGWINKAYQHTSQAIDLLVDAGLYDDLVIKQIPFFAHYFAQHQHFSRSLALIDKGIHYLQPLFLLTDEQAKAVPIDITNLQTLRQALVTNQFQQLKAQLTVHLGESCHIFADAEQHAIYLTPTVNIYSPLIEEPYFHFLFENPEFKPLQNMQLLIEQQTLFAKNFFAKIARLATILSAHHVAALPVELEAGIAGLALAPAEETFGFQKPPGFTPIVPIQSARLPHHTLFLTMPEDSEAFVPFYKLIRDQQRTTYFPVQAIAAKGLNQHGVKLSTALARQPGQPPEKIALGRLKAGGTCRAKGLVEQTIPGEKGKQRKLYVFREVTEKKAEKRKGYY